MAHFTTPIQWDPMGSTLPRINCSQALGSSQFIIAPHCILVGEGSTKDIPRWPTRTRRTQGCSSSVQQPVAQADQQSLLSGGRRWACCVTYLSSFVVQERVEKANNVVIFGVLLVHLCGDCITNKHDSANPLLFAEDPCPR